MNRGKFYVGAILAAAVLLVAVFAYTVVASLAGRAGELERPDVSAAADRSPTSLPSPLPSAFSPATPQAGPGGLEQKLAACHSIPEDSVQVVSETTRLFLNLPKDIYPDKLHNLHFTTVAGNATAGWISNAGPMGEAFQSTPACWSYYYEFDGTGEVDLRVPSAAAGVPDYSVRFLVRSH